MLGGKLQLIPYSDGISLAFVNEMGLYFFIFV